MKRLVMLIGVVLSFTVICFAKEKIAVFDFSGAANDYKMPSVTQSEMTSLLVNQKRFDVIERSELDTIIKEQMLSTTGIFDVNDAVKIGKIGGIKYAVIGSVPNVNYSKERVWSDYSKEYIWKIDALVVLQLRIINIETAGIIFSETFNMKPGGGFLGLGKVDESTDAETTLTNIVKRYFEKNIAKKVSNSFPVEGSIMSIDKESVVIDIGSESGVNEGMKFDVISQEEKTNSKTGKKIVMERKIGVLQVKEVSGTESAVCKIKDGDDAIQEGMVVKLQKK
ncbi:MAG: CsgG/HfaB family protein [Elusimicrobiota bacterium]